MSVCLLVIGAVLSGHPILRWGVYAYTVILLLLHLVVLGMGLRVRPVRQGEPVPQWFYHLLYGINVSALLLSGSWLWAALWGLIWILAARHRSSSGRYN
ncbi:MAG: hypothetical protein N2561_03105 [Bacteroidetes bacterium]|nr:hypothetical protein [Bacteroidota bacterium]MCX7906507.1 hypothetical protein [Bacteroidota bacterium]MDW8137212.1 hypothetical protein [Bacteroidota bacterium]MDW8284918.1 hypothetical protein [Bacteroidota bacterium]